MEHIKNYKLFLEDSSSYSYEEISKQEYSHSIQPLNDEFIINNWVPFTKDEIQKIQEIIPSAYFPAFFPIAAKKYCTENDLKLEKIYKNSRILSIKHHLEITKLIDEWYYVIINYDTFFKCDQFDGLLELIENIVHTHDIKNK